MISMSLSKDIYRSLGIIRLEIDKIKEDIETLKKEVDKKHTEVIFDVNERNFE